MKAYMLTGLDRGGIRFSQRKCHSTADAAGRQLPGDVKKRPDAVASGVRHEKKDGLEILSFSLSEPTQEYLFRVVRTTGYVLTVQCPKKHAARRSK